MGFLAKSCKTMIMATKTMIMATALLIKLDSAAACSFDRGTPGQANVTMPNFCDNYVWAVPRLGCLLLVANSIALPVADYSIGDRDSLYEVVTETCGGSLFGFCILSASLLFVPMTTNTVVTATNYCCPKIDQDLRHDEDPNYNPFRSCPIQMQALLQCQALLTCAIAVKILSCP